MLQKYLIPLIFSLFPVITQAQAVCPRNTDPALVEACIDNKLEQVVAVMTHQLTRIQQRFADNPTFLAALRQSQQQWNRYRQQECGNVHLLWQDKPDQYLMSASCSINLARARVAVLQQTYLRD